MTAELDARILGAFVYGVVKAMNRTLGDSAQALMRNAAPDMALHLERMGVNIPAVSDPATLSAVMSEFLSSSGVVDSVECSLDGATLRAKVDHNKCSLSSLTKQFHEEGSHPGSCPVCMMFHAVAEKSFDKRCRLKDLQILQPDGCGIEIQLVDK